MAHDRSNTWVNALIGAVVTIVFSFTMVSPVLGGAVAGYLQRAEGAKVGAIAGLFATIPLFLLLFPLFGFFGFVGMPVFMVFIVVVFLGFIIPVYTIALSALGGFLGVYLYEEFE